MILVMFASLFCHLVSPQAIGNLSIGRRLSSLSPSLTRTHKHCSVCFRFWDPGAEDHPEGRGPEGVSDTEGLHRKSHWPDCGAGQRDAGGQRGEHTPVTPTSALTPQAWA